MPVLLPYGFTLFSNITDVSQPVVQFYYLMDLHYSQTWHYLQKAFGSFTTLWIYTILKPRRALSATAPSFTTLWIYTILKRQCPTPSTRCRFTTLWIYTILKPRGNTNCKILSFTTLWIYTILKPYLQGVHSIFRFTTLWIYTILKPCRCDIPPLRVLLPYGFTLFSNHCPFFRLSNLVLLPYGFTLFSNLLARSLISFFVLLPYGFTLFSNKICLCHYGTKVLLPYGFTLFSNTTRSLIALNMFYYLMDLHYSQTSTTSPLASDSFTTLWIYTILKLGSSLYLPSKVLLPYGFTLFSNYLNITSTQTMFYYLMDLHYSQTQSMTGWVKQPFYYLMDLHYSQTSCQLSGLPSLFYYLMDLHYSQTTQVEWVR